MKDFVTFEIAKKLKEKGFPQKCRGKYEMQGACYIDDGRFYIDGCIIEIEEAYTAPTISQTLKWLREEKKIHIAIGYSGESKWRYIVIYLGEAYFDNPNIIEKGFYSYEEASIAGIEYVLDNLF